MRLSDETLYAGANVIAIQGFGTVQIKLTLRDGSRRNFDLLDVAYVPDFHTSVVSFRRLYNNNIHWDTKNLCLTWGGDVFALTPIRFGQWVLEYNEIDSSTLSKAAFAAVNSRLPKRPLQGTLERWHQRFGHIGEDGLRKLMREVSGIMVTPGGTNKFRNCETCRLVNSKRIISRRPRE